MSTVPRMWLPRRVQRGDDGVALISVVAMTVMLTALMVVAIVMATTALRSSRQHVSFDQALAAAEAGIDTNLSAVSQAYNAGNPGWTNPSPCTLPAPSAADVASNEAERTWARAQLEALPAGCTVTTPQGEFVAGRAPSRQAVYSLGWSPTRAADDGKARLLKAEYVFAPYAPGKAVLTDGDLEFDGSVAVNHVDPTVPASVHTNEDVTSINGSLDISGSLTSTGTLPASCPAGVAGGCQAAKPAEALPSTSPRTVYMTHAADEPNWYDLCPDGVARRPQVTAGVVGEPCTGSPIAGGTQWTFATVSGVPTWTYPRTSSNAPGVYYVFRGDAVLGSNGVGSTPGVRQITVIAESAPTGGTAASCGKLGGNIEWKLFDLQPYLSSLALMAEGNLTGDANATAGPGLFLAGDKVDLQTSSATIIGAIIARNACAAAGTNEIQGVTISYDQTIEAPVNDIIRTSLWLEYGGS